MKLKLLRRKTPYKRQLFAVTTGDYVGEMLAFMREDVDFYIFLSIPKLIIRSIPKDKFHFGIEHNIVELVEILPRNVFKLLKLQFEKNEKRNI